MAFGTLGSEVQILSSRPAQIKGLHDFLKIKMTKKKTIASQIFKPTD